MYEIPEVLHIQLQLPTHIYRAARLICASDSLPPIYTISKYSLVYIDAIFTRRKGGSGIENDIFKQRIHFMSCKKKSHFLDCNPLNVLKC